MAVGLDFPEDPTRPDPGQHIASGKEITIAWKKQNIALGTGLILSSKDSKLPSLGNAFRDPKEKPQVTFYRDSFTNYRQANSSSATQSSQHVSASLTLEVDLCGGLVGGSVQGSYDRQVDKNTDVSHILPQSSMHAHTSRIPFHDAIQSSPKSNPNQTSYRNRTKKSQSTPPTASA